MDLKSLPKNPIEITIKLIGCKWRILIVKELLSGTKRFSQLKKSVTGITQKVLTSKLRELEEYGILTRNQINTKVEYTLTDVGYSLQTVIFALNDWGKDYKKYLKLLSMYQKQGDN